MKWFKQGTSQNGCGENGIILDNGTIDSNRVFSIKCIGNEVVFYEECDGYFDVQFTSMEAIEMLEEAITWIKEMTDGSIEKETGKVPKRPPLGLLSREIHGQLRIKQILEAIWRYVIAKKAVPSVWVEELQDLTENMD